MTETAHRRRRRPSIASALRQVLKAGITPTSVTLAPDGTWDLKFGTCDDVNSHDNPWDKVLLNAPHKERAS